MSKVNGLAAIVEEATPTAEAPATEPVQLTLADVIVASGRSTLGPTPAAPDDESEGGEALPGRRGRPPGARNKSTDAWRRHIFALEGSPLLNLARWARQDPVQLAAYLGCKPIEALDRIIAAGRVAAPYLHSAMPTDVRVEGKGALGIAIFTGMAPGGQAQLDGGDPLLALERFAALPPSTFKQNQALGAPASGESDSAESDSAEKSEADQ